MRLLCLSLITSLLFTPITVSAGNNAPVVDPTGITQLSNRLNRLERQMRSEGLLDLLQQVENMQQEIARLQGVIEVQNHTIEQLQKRQKDLFTDVDERVQRIEERGQTSIVDNNNGLPALQTLTPALADAPLNDTESNESTLILETTTFLNNDEEDINTDENVGDSEVTVEQAPSTVTAEVVAVEESFDTSQAQGAYQAAFKLLKEGRYEEATAAFETYLQTFPNSEFSDSAQYWLGESYYVQRSYEDAVLAYSKLLEDYPESRKTAHSLLKLGYSYQELGEINEARSRLDEVRNRFPGTTPARLADERLRSLPAEEESES